MEHCNSARSSVGRTEADAAFHVQFGTGTDGTPRRPTGSWRAEFAPVVDLHPFWDCSSNIFQGFTGSASLSVNLGRCCMRGRETASGRMGKSALRVLAPKQKVSLKVSLLEREGPGWTVSLDSQGDADCPICGTRSSSRHGSYTRSLQDLPAKGTPVLIQARVTRWRCANDECERRTFAGRRPDLTAPFARRATRMAGIVRLFGHAAGGRPSERLLALLGMPVGPTTILRHVKRGARGGPATLRVAGIDGAWKKGTTYGTMIVDLERRQVVDLLADRSADSTAEWLRVHPEVEMVSRDRAGLYADGARQGAPQAGKSRIGFTCSRTPGKPSSGSWVGWVRRSGEGRLRSRTMTSTRW